MKDIDYHIVGLKNLMYRLLLSTCMINFLRLLCLRRKLKRFVNILAKKYTQVCQSIKFMISSSSCMDICDLSRLDVAFQSF